MTPQEVLLKAAKLLEDYEWIQGKMATDADGNVALVHGPEAICFCTIGAICRVVRSDNPLPLIHELHQSDGWRKQEDLINEAEGIFAEHVGCSVVLWNDADNRTKDEVIQALKDAGLNSNIALQNA